MFEIRILDGYEEHHVFSRFGTEQIESALPSHARNVVRKGVKRSADRVEKIVTNLNTPLFVPEHPKPSGIAELPITKTLNGTFKRECTAIENFKARTGQTLTIGIYVLSSL
jgi:hypothetical protein